MSPHNFHMNMITQGGLSNSSLVNRSLDLHLSNMRQLIEAGLEIDHLNSELTGFKGAFRSFFESSSWCKDKARSDKLKTKYQYLLGKHEGTWKGIKQLIRDYLPKNVSDSVIEKAENSALDYLNSNKTDNHFNPELFINGYKSTLKSAINGGSFTQNYGFPLAGEENAFYDYDPPGKGFFDHQIDRY